MAKFHPVHNTCRHALGDNICLRKRCPVRSLTDSPSYFHGGMCRPWYGILRSEMERDRAQHREQGARDDSLHLYPSCHRHALRGVDDKRYCPHSHLLWSADYPSHCFPCLSLCHKCCGVIDDRLVVDNDCHHRSCPAWHRACPWLL